MKKRITAGLLMLALTISLGQSAEGRSATSLSRKKLNLTKGSTFTLKVRGVSGKKNIIWKSSKKKVASVTKKGKVTARKKGTAVITAKIKSRKFRCRVTVTAKKKHSAPSPTPTQKPSVTPRPSAAPTLAPTPAPTLTPTRRPSITLWPSTAPTLAPTIAPTRRPSITLWPSTAPTLAPTLTPTQRPSVTLWPSTAPTLAPTIAPTKTPDASVTEADAYRILNSLRSVYPEGMSLTNENFYYYSPCFGHGYGCYGFAAKLSDTVFGTGRTCTTHSSFDSIKTGDNIRIGNYHSVIVLTKSQNSVTVVEGNFNSSVHWDRTITQTSLAREGFTVTTRY